MPWMGMAHDGGFRGDEQRQVAAMLEQEARREREAEQDEREQQAELEYEQELEALGRERQERHDADVPF